jgi:small conductance mechanosensitive channel
VRAAFTAALRSALLISLLIAPAIPSAAESEAQPDDVGAKLAASSERRDEVVAGLESATGRQRLLLEERLRQIRFEAQQLLAVLAAELLEQQEAGEDVTQEVNLLFALLRERWPDFQAEIRAREAAVEELLANEAAIDGGSDVEYRLVQERRRLEETYRLLIETLVSLAPLKLELEEFRTFAADGLGDWAEGMLAEVRLAVRQQEFAAERAAAAPEDAERQSALQVAGERVAEATRGLSAAVDMMEELEVPTARYDEALIATTGEITSDILNANVTFRVLGRMRYLALDGFASGGPSWLFKTFVFVLILAAFRAGSLLIRRFVEKSVNASKLNLSQLLKDTLVGWSARVVMLVGVLVAISQLGIQIGPLLAGLGIVGFVLGFALQDSLSNFAAGAMILLYRPFDVGDLVEAAGARGVVQRMTLVSSTILTLDNQTLIIPNNKIWGDVILNVTAQKIRRVDLVFGIGYGDDIEKADAVLRDILAKHEKVLDEPEPVVEVHELGESSVNFVVRPWVKTEEYWPVHWSITREVKKRFDSEGISIPFPQRDVHHYVERSDPTSGTS